MEGRENFKSRLGFIMTSAGCAIGLGNVWRFPFITGQYGGAAFVLFYLIFLLALGLPIMVAEFAVGRASGKSAVRSFHALEPKGTKWHIYGYFAAAGNYLLMMFYTTVAGWMFAYIFKCASGTFEGLNSQEVGEVFTEMLADPVEQICWLVAVTLIGFIICLRGLEKGVEKASTTIMTSLLCLMLVLVVRAVTLDGAAEGLSFYLKPDFAKMVEIDGGLYHLPDMLCFRREPRSRAGINLHHAAKHLQRYAFRAHLGHTFLYFYVIRGSFDGHRGFREHHRLCNGQKRLEQKEKRHR